MKIYQKNILFFIAILFITVNCLGQENEDSNESVSFDIIEKVPVYPGCTGNNSELRDCLNKSLQMFIVKNFKAKKALNLGLSPGRKNIYIQFKITKSGEIEILGIRAPHKKLEKEAARVIKKLPKMKPGMQKGKPVNVTYMLPISFNIE